LIRIARGHLAIALCGVLFIGGAATADDLAELLSRPVSPGSLALLMSFPGKPGVSERWQSGLRSADPKTRGAAARVLDVAMLHEAAPQLIEAVTAETDAAAAVEEIRALADSGNSEAVAIILDTAHRFGARLDPWVVLIFARAQGTAALPLYFESLRQLDISEHTRTLFFEEATRGQPDALVAAAALAFGRRDAKAWQAVLNAATRTGASIHSPLLETALRSDQLVFRGEAAWYLARKYCGEPPPQNAALLAALAEGEPEGSLPVDPELHFGAELLRRVLGQAPVEDAAWIACLESSTKCHLDSDFGASPLLRYLTEREREAVARRNAADRAEEPRSETGKSPGPKPTPVAEPADKTMLRLVSGLPEGVAEDLLTIEPCKSPSSRYSVAILEFRPDGAPRRVQPRLVAAGASCQRVANALFLMSRAPDDLPDPSADRATYLALLLPKAVACTDVPAPATQPSAGEQNVVRVRGSVQAPKLESRVEPRYPEDARKRNEQGVSVYEAIITTTGCVANLRLLKSSSPELDVMGMEAIAQWRYRPASLNGRPVRVYLTVTVTYRLGR
jgi:protein TonB